MKEMIERLEAAEDNKKKALTEFTLFIFEYFHKNYKTWDKLILIMAELVFLNKN